jgi:negative regulator of replication initiation
MRTIEIEDSVYSALEKQVRGFGEKPNDVLKRMLTVAENQKSTSNGTAPVERPVVEQSPLMKFVESPEYLRGKAKERYFSVLRFMYADKRDQFEKLDGFRKGSRVQISKDVGKIRQSGRHTYPQKLDETPFWIMTNLSNERKQTLLQDIMQFLGYSKETIDVVVRTITTQYLTSVFGNFLPS